MKIFGGFISDFDFAIGMFLACFHFALCPQMCRRKGGRDRLLRCNETNGRRLRDQRPNSLSKGW